MLRWLPITLVLASALQFGASVYGLKLIDYWVIKIYEDDEYTRSSLTAESILGQKHYVLQWLFFFYLYRGRSGPSPSQMLLMRHIKELCTAFAYQSWLKDNLVSDNSDSPMQAIGGRGWT